MAKDQKEKDKSMLSWFSGSNPNRKKVREAIEKRKKKEKKDKKKRKKGVNPVSRSLGY